MSFYPIKVWDSATYVVEVDTPEEAILDAEMWFAERFPATSVLGEFDTEEAGWQEVYKEEP